MSFDKYDKAGFCQLLDDIRDIAAEMDPLPDHCYYAFHALRPKCKSFHVNLSIQCFVVTGAPVLTNFHNVNVQAFDQNIRELGAMMATANLTTENTGGIRITIFSDSLKNFVHDSDTCAKTKVSNADGHNTTLHDETMESPTSKYSKTPKTTPKTSVLTTNMPNRKHKLASIEDSSMLLQQDETFSSVGNVTQQFQMCEEPVKKKKLEDLLIEGSLVSLPPEAVSPTHLKTTLTNMLDESSFFQSFCEPPNSSPTNIDNTHYWNSPDSDVESIIYNQSKQTIPEVHYAVPKSKQFECQVLDTSPITFSNF